MGKNGRIIVKNTCYEDAAGSKAKKQATGKAEEQERSIRYGVEKIHYSGTTLTCFTLPLFYYVS